MNSQLLIVAIFTFGCASVHGDEMPTLPRDAVLLGAADFPFIGSVTPWVLCDEGRTIICCNESQTRVVDFATRTVRKSWTSDARFLMALSASADGKIVAEISATQSQLNLRDAATGMLLRTYNPHRDYPRWWVALSPDGKYTASSGSERDPKLMDILPRSDDHGLRLCDVSTSQELPAFKNGLPGVAAGSFSRDSRHFAWSSYDHVKQTSRLLVRPLAGGADIVLPMQSAVGHRDSLAFSHDSKRLAVHHADGRVTLWDLATATELKAFPNAKADPQHHDLMYQTIQFSPDDKYLLTARCFRRHEWDNQLVLRDIATGKTRVISTEPFLHNGVAFAADGKRVFALRQNHSLHHWDVATGTEENLVGHRREVTSAAVSRDGKTIVTAGRDDTLRFWNRDTGKEVQVIRESAEKIVAIAYLGELIVSSSLDGKVRIQDAAKSLAQFEAHAEGIHSMSFSHDGKHLATGGTGSIRIWDTATWKLTRTITDLNGWITALAFSHDGAHLYVGNDTWSPVRGSPNLQKIPDTSFQVLDVASGKLLHTFPNHHKWAVTSISASADGKMVAGNCGNAYANLTTVYDAETNKDLASMPGGASAVVFSPDSKLFAMAGGHGGHNGPVIVELFGTATWKRVASFNGHCGRVTSLTFTPDSRSLISTSDDSTSIVWKFP